MHNTVLLGASAGPRPHLASFRSRAIVVHPAHLRSAKQGPLAVKAEASNEEVKDGIRCYMTKEGALVCEKLEPGNYRLEAAAPKQHGESDAIACDPTRPEECLTYCYVMDDGSMVCEGLPAGDYAIKQATADDVERMVQHALALKAGKTYKDVSPMLADEVKAEEPKGGILGKITGLFRST